MRLCQDRAPGARAPSRTRRLVNFDTIPHAAGGEEALLLLVAVSRNKFGAMFLDDVDVFALSDAA